MPPNPKSAAPLKLNTNRDCYVFCFGMQAPLAAASLLLLESLIDHQGERKPGSEWIIFSGVSSHSSGLTSWLAVTDNIPLAARDLFLERVDALGVFGNYEAVEMCRPSGHPELKPVLWLSDEGPQVLVVAGAVPPFTRGRDSLPIRLCTPVTR